MAEPSPLRPHQAEALQGLRDALRAGYRRPLVAAPTGYGKTILAAHIIALARGKGKRVAFCVPSLGLVDQTFERFRSNGIPPVEMGVLQGDHPWRRPHAPIQIATAQTLARRSLPQVDLAIIDEAHIRHRVYDRWMAEACDVIFIGLSATPWTRGLGRLYDHLIRPVSLSDLIEHGHLAPFRVFAPSHPDLTSCRTVAGDWHEGDLVKVMGKPRLVADLVDNWLVRGKGRPTLCYAVNREHARMIHDRFAESGVRVAYVDANTPREERDAIGRDLASGAVQVAVNIGTLTTGIDWDVRCIILARPTRSEMLFVQIIGRGLRTAPGKADCVILDHSDTHQRLGMVTDISHDDLDMGRPKEKGSKKTAEKQIPLPACCPSCSALMPITQRVCVSCGAAMPTIEPVEEVDGDLIEIGRGGVMRASEIGDEIIAALKGMPRPDVIMQLEAVRLSRGYSPGWVRACFYEIFGESAPHMDGDTESLPPSPELLAWLRRKAKAYAQKMAREAAIAKRGGKAKSEGVDHAAA